jgi:hypothetical protein
VPRLAAVERLEQAGPRIGVRLESLQRIERAGQVDGPVVIGAGEQVHRIARRRGARRLVLALKEGIAVRKGRPRDHVDVRAADHLLLRADAGAESKGGCDRERDRRENAQPTDGT